MIVATSSSAEEPLALRELPFQTLGAADVRVRVRAIGVNPVDWKMRAGGPLRLAHRFIGPVGPLVVGVDFAGEVFEAGPGSGLAVGDRVVGGTNFARGQRGSYADEVVVAADQCVLLPDAVGFEEAACLPVAAVTPWISLTEHAQIGEGDRVLVLGASGGVGLMAIALAQKLGAEAVGVCSRRNVELVERLGATAVDYTAGDALTAAAAHGPYQLIIHAVGTELYPLDRCRSLLAEGGLVDLAVVRPADMPSAWFSKQVSTVLGRVTGARLAPLVQALADGELAPIIQRRFPLAEAEQAHALSRAGKVVGKLLLIP
jgi:NADPH:quinone reductase-like Zn-dependent oxidoreductase